MEKIKQVNIKLSSADLRKRFKELGLRYNKVYKKIVKESNIVL